MNFRSVNAGYFTSIAGGRIGRRTNSPPQFGQAPFSGPATQSLQNVHSNVQIIASRESGGRSRSQHSQFGRSASMSSLRVENRSVTSDHDDRYGGDRSKGYPLIAALMASTVPTS